MFLLLGINKKLNFIIHFFMQRKRLKLSVAQEELLMAKYNSYRNKVPNIYKSLACNTELHANGINLNNEQIRGVIRRIEDEKENLPSSSSCPSVLNKESIPLPKESRTNLQVNNCTLM